MAAGGIAAALLVPSATVGHNIIGAGHLVLQVNHGEGSSISIDNLAPGESRSGDQLLTADMAGIGTADLVLTLSGAEDGPFAENAWMTVSYSEPAAESDAHWDGSTCAATGGYTHTTSTMKFAAFVDSHQIEMGQLAGTLTPSEAAVCVRFTIGLDATAGNDVQAKGAALTMNYSLTQTSAADS